MERAALERDISDLGLRTAAAVRPARAAEADLHNFGATLLPPVLRELEGPRHLFASPRGKPLAGAVESLLQWLEAKGRAELAGQTFTNESGAAVTYSDIGIAPPAGRPASAAVHFGDLKLNLCIERSLGLFALACNKLDVPIEFLRLGKGAATRVYPVPRIARATDKPVNLYRFLYLWFSAVTHPNWTNDKIFPNRYRGAGAAGALRFSGLAAGAEDVRSTSADLADSLWPAGLHAGALLQIWKDEATVKAVRDGKKALGHSCIFRDYKRTSNGEINREVIIVADQFGFRHEVPCNGPKWYVRYLIGAYPRRADIA